MKLIVEPGKLAYLFGHATGRQHNLARANQNALQMKWLGIPDNSVGYSILQAHLNEVINTPNNIITQFENEWGNFEIRESLFVGPSGKFVKLESAWQIIPNDSRRLVTVIPKSGKRS